MIIPKKNENANTILKIIFSSEFDISAELDNILPYPQKHYIDNIKTIYYYNLYGFFGTKKSIEYLEDIKARFLITYKANIKNISHYNTKEDWVLELKDFQKLRSKAVSIINKTNRFDNSNDFIFWCLKLYAEDIIIERGLITFEILFDFGYKNFGKESIKSCKDNSTLKSKCRSIVNYYINKNYELDKYVRKTTNEEYKLIRQKNIKRVNIEQKKKTEEKIKTFLNSMYIEDYKKANGKLNITKISKELKISRPTLNRYLKK